MNKNIQSKRIELNEITNLSGFWKSKLDIVAKEMIPYQWDALNDNVPDAPPSFCMHNFKVASKMINKEYKTGDTYNPPKYTYRGFEAKPEEPNNIKDEFYGFVFQDSDLYKWIEAVAYYLQLNKDDNLEKTCDKAIDLVCSCQLENGYLDTYYIINGMDASFTNTKDHHELYVFGHMAEAAVAYFKATGKDKFLKATCKFADYIDDNFGPKEGKLHGYPGHEIAEMALAKIYEVTKNKNYLKLSEYFINQRGQKPYFWFSEDNGETHDDKEHFRYYQAHKPIREQKHATGHAVRAMYLYSGVTDIAKYCNDDSLFEASDRLFDDAVNKQMYITGAFGSNCDGESFSFDYDLPNDLVYGETCASIGFVFWALRMLELNPNSKYSDAMEKALYNTILSGMSLDAKSFFYVNPLEVNPQNSRFDSRKRHIKPTRQKWFGCACCPPNLSRMILSLPSYAYTKNNDTLFVHLHISNELKYMNTNFKFESELPYKGNYKISCLDGFCDTTIAVRIPSWSKKYSLSGVDSFECIEKDGYLYISGTFDKNTNISFEFDMTPKMMMANNNVSEDINKIAFTRGPITYCVEEIDNSKDLYLYFADTSSKIIERSKHICTEDIIELKINAKKKIKNTSNDLYSEFVKPTYEDSTLKLIPYYTWANRGENEMSVWIKHI